MSLMTVEEQAAAWYEVFMPVLSEAGKIADDTGEPAQFSWGMWDISVWPGTISIPATTPPCKSRSRT